MSQSKCEMARLRYCRKSSFGYCNADDTDVERCPYLKAIEEIARLSVENSQLEDDLKWLWSWIEVIEVAIEFQSIWEKEKNMCVFEFSEKYNEIKCDDCPATDICSSNGVIVDAIKKLVSDCIKYENELEEK